MRRSIRLRLTALYSAVFAASGAVLLGITYLLVSRSAGQVLFGVDTPAGLGDPGDTFHREVPALPGVAQRLQAEAARLREAVLHELVTQSGIALTVMVIVSVALGWLVAGRALRPMRAMASSVRDISARNLHERLAVRAPHDEVKDLADTVDGLLGRLEAAFDAQKHFVANAAHELRTPLTLERALLEETLTDPDATPEALRATCERLLALSKEQDRRLEALLALAAGERGLERREPFDLRALVERVLLAHPDPRISASLSPASVAGDQALVERLVANLVGNAVQYNLPGGRVEIGTGTREGRAFLSVANTGPVVPADQVERLFEPFERLDSERTARDGGHHGLGLSIVRAIAVAHDAELTARPGPAGGLVVEVRLPG
ncbi:sensor histidine kinase [Nonomuraea sp. NPDC050536]|uniref:sensor histidine kinase n=1 Tax=Nonomuraea sp. NPDC050536 TaxID=3364366 RepID=UPI0037CB4F4E